MRNLIGEVGVACGARDSSPVSGVDRSAYMARIQKARVRISSRASFILAYEAKLYAARLDAWLIMLLPFFWQSLGQTIQGLAKQSKQALGRQRLVRLFLLVS